MVFLFCACSSQTVSTNDNDTQSVNSIASVEQPNEELQSEYEELQSEYDTLKKKYEVMNIQLENKANECNELLEQMDTLNKRNAEFEEQIKQQVDEIAQLKAFINTPEENIGIEYYKLIDRNNILEQKIMEIRKGNNSFEFNDENLSWLMNISKKEVIDTLGYNYICYGKSIDDLVYSYPVHGINIKFDDNAGVSSIEFDDDTIINGIKKGMTFQEIKDVLGHTEIIKANENNTNATNYYIVYSMDNYEIYCYSSEKEGKVNGIEVKSALPYNPILRNHRLIGAVRNGHFYDFTGFDAQQLTYKYNHRDIVSFCMTRDQKEYKLYKDNGYIESAELINTYMQSSHYPYLHVDLKTKLNSYDWDYAFGIDEWEPVPRSIRSINPTDTHKSRLEAILKEYGFEELPSNITALKLVDIDNDGQGEEFIQALYVNQGNYSYAIAFMIKENEIYMILNKINNDDYPAREIGMQFYDIDGNGTMEVFLHYYYTEDSYVEVFNFKDDRFIKVLSDWVGA